MRDGLPEEIIALIMEHRAAMVLQSWARAASHRAHVRRPAWKHLRRMLVDALDWRGLDVLAGCPQVRKEWRQEPESWIHEMVRDPAQAAAIVKEVKGGFWTLGTALDPNCVYLNCVEKGETSS